MDARGCCRLEFTLRAANNHGPDQSSDNKKALLHSAKRLAEMNGEKSADSAASLCHGA